MIRRLAQTLLSCQGENKRREYALSKNDREHQAVSRSRRSWLCGREFGLLGSWIRGGGGEDFLKRGHNFGNTERFLEMARLAGVWQRFERFDERSRHVDENGFAGSRRSEQALGGQLATDVVAILREIQIAEDNVGRTIGQQVQGFFEGGGTVDVQIASGKAFKEQTAEALFIVQHED